MILKMILTALLVWFFTYIILEREEKMKLEDVIKGEINAFWRTK